MPYKSLVHIATLALVIFYGNLVFGQSPQLDSLESRYDSARNATVATAALDSLKHASQLKASKDSVQSSYAALKDSIRSLQQIDSLGVLERIELAPLMPSPDLRQQGITEPGEIPAAIHLDKFKEGLSGEVRRIEELQKKLPRQTQLDSASLHYNLNNQLEGKSLGIITSDSSGLRVRFDSAQRQQALNKLEEETAKHFNSRFSTLNEESQNFKEQADRLSKWDSAKLIQTLAIQERFAEEAGELGQHLKKISKAKRRFTHFNQLNSKGEVKERIPYGSKDRLAIGLQSEVDFKPLRIDFAPDITFELIRRFYIGAAVRASLRGEGLKPINNQGDISLRIHSHYDIWRNLFAHAEWEQPYNFHREGEKVDYRQFQPQDQNVWLGLGLKSTLYKKLKFSISALYNIRHQLTNQKFSIRYKVYIK